MQRTAPTANVPVPQPHGFGPWERCEWWFRTTSAPISAAGRPGLLIMATVNLALGVSALSNWSRVRPAPRKNAFVAFSGAVGLGALRSSVKDGPGVPAFPRS